MKPCDTRLNLLTFYSRYNRFSKLLFGLIGIFESCGDILMGESGLKILLCGFFVYNKIIISRINKVCILKDDFSLLFSKTFSPESAFD